MANVKISLLPSQTDILQVDGLAGYDSSGTIKISGTDLRNSLLSPTSGNLQIRPQAGTLVLGLQGQNIDINGNTQINGSLNLSVDSNIYGVIATSTLTSVSFDGTAASTSTGYAVRLSGPVADSTNAVGTSGQVLSSTGSGTQWVAAGGPTPGIGDVLNASQNTNSGQKINFIDGGTVAEVSTSGIFAGGNFSIVQGGAGDLLVLGNNTSPTNLLCGAGQISLGDTSNNISIATNGSDKIQFSCNGTGEVEFYLGSNNPGPAIGDVLTAKSTSGAVHWVTPSSGGGGGYTTLTPAASTVWDGSNGLSASWQPTVTTPFNTLDMSSGFSAGDRGSLIIDVSTTTNFILPSNSKAADGDISVSGVNKTILDYVYDGTNFYWSNRKNMIDPIYLPTVATNNLVSFYIPSQYQGSPGNVAVGSAWINSYTSNNLVGDLSRVGTDLDDVQFVAKDDVNQVPAHFLMGSDGSTSSYWNVASALGGNVLGGSWTGTLWFKTISTTSSGFHGIMDPDKDDDESIYVYNRRLYIEGPNLYTNFPSFEPAATGGNDNAFSLEDEWIYVSVSFDHPNNTLSVILACQATLDNAGGTIIGYNGSNINISADGTYQETLSATLTDNTWDDFAYGASVSSAGTAFSFEGGIGLAAVYGTNITDTLAISNWNSTKQYYYIS